MGRLRRSASALMAGAFILGFFAEPHADALSLNKLREQWQSAARSIGYLQSRLRPLKRQQKAAAQNLDSAKHRLEVTQRTLRDVQDQLRDTRTRLVVTATALDIVRGRLKERNDLLAERLVGSYKYGNVSYLNVVLGASDFWELLNGGFIVRKILQKDVELLESIKQDKMEIEQKKAVLEEQKRVRSQLEVKHRYLTYTARVQTVECRQILLSIEQQRELLERQLAEELSSSRRIAAMLRRMQQSTPEGRRRLAKPWRGSFIWPVNGRITSPFGMRYHPILHSYRMHTGTDIAAPWGTPIAAAAGGVVLFAGYYDNVYGYTVMIDHGGGVSTFYGHCSSVCVGSGQTVRQGQTVARIGSTGLSTGPHVHFEVQKNGRPISP